MITRGNTVVNTVVNGPDRAPAGIFKGWEREWI